MTSFNKNETIQIRDIEFYSNDEGIFSIGFMPHINKEFWILQGNFSLQEIKPILRYLVEFIQDNKLELKHGDKLTCFTWSIALNENGDYFEIFEAYPKKKTFTVGLDFTHQVVSEQFSICEKLNVPPQFPLFDQLVTIDPLVKTGLPAHLFRWEQENPDSGWVAMTENFDGDSTSFEQITLGQFMTLRPESNQFMALPPGFKVIWDGEDAKIGFDEKMLK